MAVDKRFDSSAASPEELAFKGTLSNEQRGNSINGDLDRSASVRGGDDGQMFVSGANMLQGSSTSSGDSNPLAQSSMLDPITVGGQKYTRSTEFRRVLGKSSGNTLEDGAFRTANLKSPFPAATKELKRFKACMQEACAKARHGSKRLDESIHKLNKCWEAVNAKKQFQNELLPNEMMSGSHLSKLGSQTHQSPTELANQRLEDRPKNVILNKRIRTSAAEIQAEGQSNSFVRQPSAIGKNKDNIRDSAKVCGAVDEKIQRLPASGETWDRKMLRKRSKGNVFDGSIDEEGDIKRVMHLKQANVSGMQSCDAKGLRSDVRDKNYTGGNYPLTKGKASRAPRTGSPISHIAQWVGQRPQKISRTRRANMVFPVLNCDELPAPLEGCSPSDVGTRVTSTTTSGQHISKGDINSIQLGRMKHENDSSPTKLFESEECGAGENGESKLKEKGLGRNKGDERAINNSCNISSYVSVTQKKKMLNKEEIEIGDGLHSQCSGSSGFSVLKTGISSRNEKLEILTLTNPIQNMKPSSEKNASRSRQPRLKKSRNSKAIAHLGHPSTNNSPDIAGRSGDDGEELLSAANFASNASYIGCSSSFWKKMEPNFAPVNLEDIAYLKQLVKTIEDDQRCLSQMLCLRSDVTDGVVLTDNLLSQSCLEGEIGRNILSQTDSKELSSMVDMVEQHHDDSFLCSEMDSESKLAPLYQRVLTALIIDDQIDETVGDGNISSMCERDDPLLTACFSRDFENQFTICRTKHGFNTDTISCNGNATFTCGTNIHVQDLDDVLQVDHRPCSSSLNHHFEQMCVEDKLLLELHSVGLYPEPVPDLADSGCEAIDQDIIQLQKGHFQQLTEKREYFMKLTQAVEEGREMEQRALEQVAMDKLVELAYKKKLATRATSAARYGLSKVSRPVALAFMKRTLARCRTFEETGKSCFLDPVFKDVLFATPAHDNYTISADAENRPLAQNSQQESPLPGSFPCGEQNVLGNPDHPSDMDFAGTGSMLNRGKKEVLLDDVGVGASLRPRSTLGNSFMIEAKGKGAERERDKDTSGRNSVKKGGRPSARNSRGRRKMKAKAKPNAAQLSTSAKGSLGMFVENANSAHQYTYGSDELVPNGNNRKSQVGSVSHGYTTNELAVETEEPLGLTNIHELDSIEVGVDNELNGHQDLDSWLKNIDEDALEDDAVGLDIPMDDLSMVL
uniref:Uncharacterized protein LOC101491556 isoform X3 n=1 Tax=Cicer arietinum TaxID=3827 RepID=A0A3Q7XQD7_CICAR|nr:uncharacterized protein LOC101491556 isoform X3 [Cicer arietinum]